MMPAGERIEIVWAGEDDATNPNLRDHDEQYQAGQ